jgi:hypothetical protein
MSVERRQPKFKDISANRQQRRRLTQRLRKVEQCLSRFAKLNSFRGHLTWGDAGDGIASPKEENRRSMRMTAKDPKWSRGRIEDAGEGFI